jgi:hypothetical protein
MVEPIWWWSVPANRSAVLRDPVPCSACSCTGKYVDYAGPGVPGGVLVPCKSCDGRGWVERK